MQVKAAAPPHGWVNASLADVCNLNPRDDLSSFSDETLFSFIGMASVDALTGQMDTTISRPLSAVRKGFTQFQNGDLLLAKITPCLENGKFCIAQDLINGRGFGSTEFHVLRAERGILAQYLFYWTIQQRFRNDAAHNMKGTAGQKRVPVDWIAASQLPLAPTREQARIVVAIDELFARLDAAGAAIEKASALCDQFQAAALAASVKNASLGDPRFSTEDPWRIGTIGEVSTGTTPPTAQLDLYGGDLAFFKPTDLNQGYWVEYPRQTLSPKGAEFARLLPPKAVMVTCIGATIGKLGLSRVPSATNQQINSVVVDPEIALPEWLYWVMKSPYGQRQIIDNSTATTLPLLNKSRFSEIPIPISSIQEQKEAVAKIEHEISSATTLLSHVDGLRDHLESLRQSILAAAFRGELVPQDPKDEPASVLLDRIRAQRAATAAAPKARKTVPTAPARRKRA
jgi:type I restriction enzyme, S subunit